jgi:3-oxoacyl-(acyl-carrier-protein) synthase
MRRGIVPPTLNLSDADVAPLHLPRVPLERDIRRVVSNNFAFGGINASLVVGRPPAGAD